MFAALVGSVGGSEGSTWYRIPALLRASSAAASVLFTRWCGTVNWSACRSTWIFEPFGALSGGLGNWSITVPEVRPFLTLNWNPALVAVAWACDKDRPTRLGTDIWVVLVGAWVGPRPRLERLMKPRSAARKTLKPSNNNVARRMSTVMTLAKRESRWSRRTWPVRGIVPTRAEAVGWLP